MKDLEGRVAVVAGATRGAGRSTTNFFSVNGVSVAAMCAESHQYRPLLAAKGGGISGKISQPTPKALSYINVQKRTQW